MKVEVKSTYFRITVQVLKSYLYLIRVTNPQTKYRC